MLQVQEEDNLTFKTQVFIIHTALYYSDIIGILLREDLLVFCNTKIYQYFSLFH